MPKILFWNLGKRNLVSAISDLCDRYEAEILILAESQLSDAVLLERINASTDRPFIAELNLSKRLRFYARFPLERLFPLLDKHYFSIRKCRPYLGKPFLLVAVHLPSKLHAGPIDQQTVAAELSRSIREFEALTGIDRTVVIGDFNMSPFEDGMVSATGLHAMLDRNIARKISRKLRGEDFPYFYNPMWGRLGDLTEGPSGTFKYHKAVEVSHFWHTFDQVLIRPALIDQFAPSDLEVIDNNNSDHMPLFFNLRTEKV